jgi:hypothetical protein
LTPDLSDGSLFELAQENARQRARERGSKWAWRQGEMRRKPKKDTKIEGTNRRSPLESIKVSKNKSKTNWFLCETNPILGQKMPKNTPPVQL